MSRPMYQVLLCIDGFDEMPWSVEYKFEGIVECGCDYNAQCAMAWQGESSGQVEVL